MLVLMGAPSQTDDHASDPQQVPVSPPGVIGAAVIKAARRSAGLAQRRLARTLETSVGAVRAWENGTAPLFDVDYGQICELADTFGQAGAQVGAESADFVLASQCDLLVTGMLHGFEDYAEIPPIDEHGTAADAARDLLRWALAGHVPERYRGYAAPGTLLAKADAAFFAYLARELQAGSHGHDLTSYGTALVALTER